MMALLWTYLQIRKELCILIALNILHGGNGSYIDV
jgi:hypothetical protein